MARKEDFDFYNFSKKLELLAENTHINIDGCVE